MTDLHGQSKQNKTKISQSNAKVDQSASLAVLKMMWLLLQLFMNIFVIQALSVFCSQQYLTSTVTKNSDCLHIFHRIRLIIIHSQQ